MRLLLSSCLGALGIELTQQLNQAIAKYDVSAKTQEAPAAQASTG